LLPVSKDHFAGSIVLPLNSSLQIRTQVFVAVGVKVGVLADTVLVAVEVAVGVLTDTVLVTAGVAVDVLIAAVAVAVLLAVPVFVFVGVDVNTVVSAKVTANV
jgi:hypothetical protein